MKKTGKHTWKPGDLFIHEDFIYMYVAERHGVKNIRLLDSGTYVAVAAENWSDSPEAEFICNIQEAFTEIERILRENKHAL